MSIVKACRIGGGICLLCILVLLASTAQVIRATMDMEEFAANRLDSLLLAQEVRATSSGLTANARAYVSTGDQTYEDKYWRLVNIRSGEIARPQEAAVAPGVPVPMGMLLVEAGFTPQELGLLEESVKISSALVLIEEQA